MKLNLDYKRIALHILFWLSIYVAFNTYSVLLLGESFKNIFTLNLFELPTDMLGVYVVLYFLLPRFLFKRRYVEFILYLIVFIFVLVFFITIPIEYYVIKELKNSTEEIDVVEFAKFRGILALVVKLMIIGIAVAIKLTNVWLKNLKKRQKIEKDKLEVEIKLREAELKLLRAQIHPHFLFNTLNNLYGLTLEKSDKAPELVLKISNLLDYMLYRCNTPKVLLIKEIEHIRNYIELEEIRYDDRLKINFDVEGDISDQKIIPLLLIPFVENSFKHGVSKELTDSFIDIKIAVKENELSFIIKNSNQQKDTKPDSDIPSGIGLKNVKQRLEMIYAGNYSIDIITDDNTYTVSLFIKGEF